MDPDRTGSKHIGGLFEHASNRVDRFFDAGNDVYRTKSYINPGLEQPRGPKSVGQNCTRGWAGSGHSNNHPHRDRVMHDAKKMTRLA